MTKEEKIEIFADVLGIDVEDVSATSTLSSFDEWDSLAALSLMAVLSSKFHKTITPAEVKELKTVDEVLNLME